MIIIVTGSVGTGKSVISKALARKLGYKYLNINDLIKKNKLYIKYNKKLDTHEVNVKKLKMFFIKLIRSAKNNLILDSHLSHYIPRKYVDYCVVCKCGLKLLKKRLEARKYINAKIRENLDSEIFDVCLVEALENKHNVILIDTTTTSVNECIKEIIKKIK